MLTLTRLAHPGDVPAIHALYAPIVIETHVSFELVPPSEEEIRHRLQDGLAQGYPWLVCESDGGVIAYAYASQHRRRAGYRWTVESSVYVLPAHRARGVGRTLYRSLLAIVGLQGYQAVCAVIALPNPASVALHARLGFREIGRFERVGYKRGRWWDTLWMERLLGPPPLSPPEPLSIAEAMRHPEWEASLRAG